ncbi:MAG: PAS domain S-box protein [Thermoanaerobaculia bacterium]|nr:PAS domain S-box protein [Thermoanaerobaculia bacterium]
MILSVTGAYFLTHLGGGEERTDATVVRLVVGVCFQTLLYLLLLRLLRGAPKAQAYIQFIGDLLLITFLISELGEGAGNFSILYLAVISVAAALLRRSAAMIIAGLAFIAYGSYLALPTVAGWLGRHGIAIEVGPILAEGRLLYYNLGIHLIGFYLVAILTSYLAWGVTRAEEELQEKSHDLAHLQVLHRDVIQSISSGLVTTDLKGLVTSLNRAGEEILGISELELLRKPIWVSRLFDQEGWAKQAQRAEQGKKERSETVFEINGQLLYIGFSLTLLKESDGSHQGYILNFQDLTEARLLEERLRRNDRMAAIGQTAAGIAHEVGNPLAAISGAVQLLASGFRGSEEERKLLEITVKESRRLDRTIKDFLKFARPRDRTQSRFDVVALIADCIQLLRTSEEVLPEHAIVADFSPPTLVIAADPDLLRQVFWNLSSNALRAMPRGGCLTIAGRIVDGHYRISFRDTGSGMTEEERTNLFQPFRSFFDGGTGLGMAIVYSIVQEHGGETLVESTPGKGSLITVELPLDLAGRPAHQEESVS